MISINTHPTESLKNQPLLNGTGCSSFDVQASYSDNGNSIKVDLSEIKSRFEFEQDYKLWEDETIVLSANNFDNAHFTAIVNRGKDSVPYIYERLKKGPTPLIHALELIFPDMVHYRGFVSLNQARRIWLRMLKKQKLV